ncbi:hypothetical protein J3A83DRAFT_4189146 [Scleroderma citrinum]
MAASPNAVDSDMQTRDKWGSADDQDLLDDMGPVTTLDHDTSMDDLRPAAGVDDPKTLVAGRDTSSDYDKNKNGSAHDRPAKSPLLSGLVLKHRLRLAQPNKVYIGGLPEHTRSDDLRNCFGKLGNIVNIELKTGYGFVEFDSRESAEESVAKYHEGYFMGNKVRVEIAHGKGRATKRSEDPGACFKCGESGHWAKECSRQATNSRGGVATESSLIERIHPRDYPLSKDHPAYRDDPGRHPSRDSRYYDYTAAPTRDYRRPLTPPRDNRDYPVPPPRSSRDDDYKMRGPPPPPPPPSRYDRSDKDTYPSRYPPPPSRDYYDRYDRRPATEDRYVPSQPPYGGRPRTPPGPPPSRRDDFDRPSRAYDPPPERVERGRPMTPPRHTDYPRGRSVEAARYRRRSLSPPHRSSQYESSYSNSAPYSGNGHTTDKPSAPLRDSGRSRDYHRNGRDSESNTYRRI